MMTRSKNLALLIVVCAGFVLLVAACAIGEDDLLANDMRNFGDDAAVSDDLDDDADDRNDLRDGDGARGQDVLDQDALDQGQGSSGAFELSGGDVDLSLDRDDIDCSDEGLGSDDTASFLVAHVVVDGNLGAVCFGESDPTLIRSWETLAAITPPGQLRDLGLFGGFIAGEETGGTTLAFVNILDDDGSLFQMSINLDEADADPEELLLTMAHEFSHVFTATSPQIDRFAGPGTCDTFFNGEGCYIPGSIMAEWVRLFWGDGLIDEIDVDEEPTVDGGEQRCSNNPSFFGAYAASSPEEDFAETFSVFVFDVPADTNEQQAKIDWIASQPGLAEFRDRAMGAGFGPLANYFDRCG